MGREQSITGGESKQEISAGEGFSHCDFVLAKGMQSGSNGTYIALHNTRTLAVHLCVMGTVTTWGALIQEEKESPPGTAFVIWVLRMKGDTVESSQRQDSRILTVFSASFSQTVLYIYACQGSAVF